MNKRQDEGMYDTKRYGGHNAFRYGLLRSEHCSRPHEPLQLRYANAIRGQNSMYTEMLMRKAGQ